VDHGVQQTWNSDCLIVTFIEKVNMDQEREVIAMIG